MNAAAGTDCSKASFGSTSYSAGTDPGREGYVTSMITRYLLTSF